MKFACGKRMASIILLAAGCFLSSLSGDSQPREASALLSATLYQESLEEQFRLKEIEVQTAPSDSIRMSRQAELTKINQELEKARLDFELLASKTDVSSLGPSDSEPIDLKREFSLFLSPMFRELSKLTAHPREATKLRAKIEQLNMERDLVNQGLKNIESQLRLPLAAIVLKRLKILQARWSEHLSRVNNQLSFAEYQLEQKASLENSPVASIQSFIRTFLRTRGRNLLLAILSFTVVFFLLRFFPRSIMRRRSRHSKTKPAPFYARLLNLLYYLLTFLMALLSALLILYVSGDWVVLGLVLLFLFGVAWAARQGILHFWEQAKLLLNVGPVRENERILLNGIPFKINRINLSCKLENPLLTGAILRLPVKDLTALRSRAFDSNETWFPTRPLDWVLLSDQTFGQVISQTIESVTLHLKGGSVKTYRTVDFLSLAPNSLSRNFQIEEILALDFCHQSQITGEIPAHLEKFIRQGLTASAFASDLKEIRVEFKSVGLSSLNLLVTAEFLGNSASEYFFVKRQVQSMAVDCCNQMGWKMPFNQVTIHQAK